MSMSDESPPEEWEGLDYERCAALHNHVVELGWTQRGLSLDILDKRTWWECHGGDAALASTAERLDASVVSFLKAAWHGFAMEPAAKFHHFHRYLGCLCSPERLWNNSMYAEDEDDTNKRRYITLYMANWQLSPPHPLGLVLNQTDGTAMQHMSIHHSDITLNGRQLWIPLEMILNGYVGMIEQGKMLAVDDSYSGEQEWTEPWITPSYTEQDLEDALQAFDRLVGAVHVRMPSQLHNADKGLLETVTGGHPEILPANSFAHRFLTRCSKPKFTYIAPGLSIARHQPFVPASGRAETNQLFPLLLFSSTSSAYKETERAPWGEEFCISPFARDYQYASPYPAGLYFTETKPHGSNPFEDGCKLILPFTLGSNTCARTSDGALIGEYVQNPEESTAYKIEPKSTQLYQEGYNHFIAAHDVQLRHVLRKWVEIIEEGKWQVDENGVVGDIEKWMEAYTEEHWADYQLMMTW